MGCCISGVVRYEAFPDYTLCAFVIKFYYCVYIIISLLFLDVKYLLEWYSNLPSSFIIFWKEKFLSQTSANSSTLII